MTPPAELPVSLNEAADRSELRVLDPSAEAEMIRRIDAAKQAEGSAILERLIARADVLVQSLHAGAVESDEDVTLANAGSPRRRART